MNKYFAYLLISALCLTGITHAATIGFSTAEGYIDGALQGQPGGVGSNWSVTENNSYSIMNVQHTSSAEHPDRINITLSRVHGVGDNNIIDYAAKRMTPVSGEFTAGFNFYNSAYANDVGDETCIALGQSADSGWGAYLGLNKTSKGSLAYHNGADWIEIVTGLTTAKWYSVLIDGDVTAGLFDLTIYREELMDSQDLSAGRLASETDLDFRDNPDSLAYVMLTNEGSSEDTGAYSHLYDDLHLVPEPTTLILLGLGGLAQLRRRKR